jgi:long-chain acyl-CoA synthetase
VSERTLVELLGEAVAAHPRHPAVIDAAGMLTHGELGEQVARLAGALWARGVRPGDRVALGLGNCAEFFVSFHAIASVGGVVAPLSTRFRAYEVARCLSDFEVSLAITSQELAPLYREVSPRDRMPILAADDREFAALLSDGPALVERPAMHPGQPLMFQSSSGSTGPSKRILRSHRNLTNEARDLATAMRLDGSDRVLCVVPLFHTYGLGNCLQAPLQVGATTVLLPGFHRESLLDTLSRERITVFPGVPFIFGALGDLSQAAPRDLSALRLCMSAGSPLPPEVFERFLSRWGIAIRQQYGSTETGAIALNLAPAPESCAESVGRPIPGVEIAISSGAGSRLQASGEGEIAVRSRIMTDGYYRNEPLTRERFVDGFFLTGDLGRIDSGGTLTVLGRKKIFIDTKTHKVDPSEVEELVASHPAVREVAVVGAPGDYGSEVVKAVIVANRECTPEEIIAHCKGRIADYKIPSIVEFRETLPRSPLGKVLRKYLLEPLE